MIISQRYFAISRSEELFWYEKPRGTDELKLAGRMELGKLAAIKREKPVTQTI